MPEAQVAPRVPDHRGHLPGYMEGASAEAAAQKLIDGGLFADSPAKAEPAVAAPVVAKAPEQPIEAKAAPEAPQTDAQAQEEGYASVDDYLTKAQLDRDSFFSLPVKAKVDGQERDVPLADLVKSYQLDQHLSAKSNAFAEERRAFEAARQQATQELQQRLTLSQQLAQIAHQELMREYQGVTPADPARYLEAQQRLGAIQQVLAQTQGTQQQLNAQQLAAEQARLLDAVPEWRDSTKFQEASKQLSSYAATRGFSPAELSGVTDHRYLLILQDAARAKDLQAQVDTLKAQLDGKTAATLKLVRAAPPMASPGARTQQSPNTSRLQQAKSLMHSGKMRSLDAQAAVAQALLDAGAA